MPIRPADLSIIKQLPNTRANSVITKLRAYNNRISGSAFEVVLRRLEQIPAGAPDHVDLKRLDLIIDKGLALVANRKRPAAEAIIAAEELGLMFVVGEKGISLALKREVEELEILREGRRIVDFETVLAKHQEVAAFNRAIRAIDELRKTDPDLLGENVAWAERDPKTGSFFAKIAYAERTKELPTAILPPAEFSLSLTMVGTENAQGIFWGGRMLYRTVPYSLTDVGDFSFSVGQAGMFLPAGDTTVNAVLEKLGFTSPAKRPALEVFACLPAPAPDAPEAERFVPRGFLRLDSLEKGMYAIVTIVQDKAQGHVLALNPRDSVVVMGEEAVIGGQRQLTYLTFESVPAMSSAREEETRSPQRGNIMVLAIPVKIYDFDFIKVLSHLPADRGWGGESRGGGNRSSFRSNDGTLGLTKGGGSTPAPQPKASLGSTHVGRDEKTVSGITLQQSRSVVVDCSRPPQIIRIVPIGISVANTPQELQATVIDFSTRKKLA